MSLRHSYTLIAPFYDLILDKTSQGLRQKSLLKLGHVEGQQILIAGVGTGLDFPHLAENACYTGVDLTPAMLKKAQARIPEQHNISLQQGDVMHLDFQDNSFDAVIMHLILAVVPEPIRALQEAIRVTRANGQILILDKFIKPDEKAYIRRMISPLLGKIATRTDVVFEELLQQCPDAQLMSDESAALGGFFRHILLRKQ